MFLFSVRSTQPHRPDKICARSILMNQTQPARQQAIPLDEQLSSQLSQQLKIKPIQVEACIRLLDDGASVPFIARYRKEQTQGLDDTQLRQLEQQLGYLRQLNQRRQSIIQAIQQQGKLSPALQQQLANAGSKSELEQLYLPYKSQRRSKAQSAREAGLEKLLDTCLKSRGHQSVATLAALFVDPKTDFSDIDTVLEGVAAILHARMAEHPSLSTQLRHQLWRDGVLRSSKINRKAASKEETDNAAKFRDYFDYAEQIRRLPSHRALALLRGVQTGILRLKLQLEPQQEQQSVQQIQRALQVPDHGGCHQWLTEQCLTGWHKKLQPQLQKVLFNRLQEQADAEAIRVFGVNLKQLLLAAPAGHKATLALDPGFRNGVKVATVDANGKLLDHAVIYPHPPQNNWQPALKTLKQLCQQHHVQLVAIGNGTASRETEQLVSELIADPALTTDSTAMPLTQITVSEAGASVYSASELAANEFPDLDVSIRGAVSIARRLQDPLAELVKIDPKAIGVGQYQHDVDQTRLADHLRCVVEDCVNTVGVDLNSASAVLLQHVSGITPTLAANIVSYRDQHGRFNSRTELNKVARLGPKAFEQAAGFLRISQARQPLDNSAVHPEAYPLVSAIAARNQRTVESLIGDSAFLKTINPADFADPQFGIPTIEDILIELDKPGRDPRPEFSPVRFADGVNSIADLAVDMRLPGVVTNVTNFGAFVDIGVHQDGLVHISQLADRFVKDPHQVVSPGDKVTVKVLQIDPQRKRIALTIKGL